MLAPDGKELLVRLKTKNCDNVKEENNGIKFQNYLS